MKKCAAISLVLFLFYGNDLSAQYHPDRYQAPIFENVDKTDQVLFSTNAPRANGGGGFWEFITGLPLNADEHDTTHINLYMDIYQPQGDTLYYEGDTIYNLVDTLVKRPVVIICFGGGFITGDKDETSMVLLATQLAQHGYVTATIDYRLGMNIFDSEISQRAVYRGVQDGRAAVRFLKSTFVDGNPYNIDTNMIFMGGHSAGAFVALHNVYLDKESERPDATINGVQDGDTLYNQGCLDCVGGNSHFSGKARSIFSLSGAVGTTQFIESSDDADLVMFHSTDDGTVTDTSGMPFMNLSNIVNDIDLPIAYGSTNIAARADSVALPYAYYQYSDRGHNVHFAGGQLYSEIIPGISSWFFDQHLQPSAPIIEGQRTICADDQSHWYHVELAEGEHLVWSVIGGEILAGDTLADSLLVLWNEAAPSRSIESILFNCNGAASDISNVNITFNETLINQWVGDDGDWSNADNWSLGHVPLACQEVTVADQLIPIFIRIKSDETFNILKLTIGENVVLDIETDAILNVREN